jgi:sensor histidine kinase YesM
MNRHFIFNSLNSIQYFINSSDKRSANKYLSSFAKLIRKNLDSSTANNFIVTLQEEVDRIELYLTLEKMRFQEKFDYELNVSSSIDAEGIEIPSMILQPFVENAIIHGVLPLEVKGHIFINIFEELGDIIFEVIDDGVGIDNTLNNKKASIAGDHESKGMEITNRRIELLRKLTGENLLIIGPFQMNDESGKTLGTKVIIKMGVQIEE